MYAAVHDMRLTEMTTGLATLHSAKTDGGSVHVVYIYTIVTQEINIYHANMSDVHHFLSVLFASSSLLPLLNDHRPLLSHDFGLVHTAGFPGAAHKDHVYTFSLIRRTDFCGVCTEFNP